MSDAEDALAGGATPYYAESDDGALDLDLDAVPAQSAPAPSAQPSARSPGEPAKKRARVDVEPAPATNGHSTTPPAAPPVSASSAPPKPSSSASDIEPSIFGVDPINELTREVAEWLVAWTTDRQHVEIEAKIGVLLHPGANDLRYPLPVATEAILTNPNPVPRFESGMSVAQHKHYNDMLNDRVQQQGRSGWNAPPITYTHVYELDEFHNVPGMNGRIRVTRDNHPKHSGTVLASVIKERVANMEVFEPKQPFDFRISVSTETPAGKPHGQPSSGRKKDRISYAQAPFRIDLTQVKSLDPGVKHELEIEIADMVTFQREAKLYSDPATQDSSRLLPLVQSFLDNVRMLIRNAPEGS